MLQKQKKMNKLQKMFMSIKFFDMTNFEKIEGLNYFSTKYHSYCSFCSSFNVRRTILHPTQLHQNFKLIKDIANTSPRKVYEKKADFFMQGCIRGIPLQDLLYGK